eukprot:1886272-Pleurochrysis_carterae.AAC.4
MLRRNPNVICSGRGSAAFQVDANPGPRLFACFGIGRSEFSRRKRSIQKAECSLQGVPKNSTLVRLAIDAGYSFVARARVH